MFGGEGKDKLTGGAGADTFVFFKEFENDTITDFIISKDVIDLSCFYSVNFDSLVMRQEGDNGL